MSASLFVVQLINSIQFGLVLFLIASGLTLVFGVMGILNLAHGSMYMIGAYLLWYFFSLTGSYIVSAIISALIALLIGIFIERVLIRRIYDRNHLDQVLLTIGMIFIFNSLQSIFWGNEPLGVPVPELLSGSIPFTENTSYPIYRLVASLICITIALGLYYVVNKTKLGMLIRAGEADRGMVEALGIDIKTLFTVVFAIGVMLAAVSGIIAAPMSSIVPGMGEGILITCFVVMVIGGIGSIKGAFVGSLLVGMISTFSSVIIPELSGMVIYVFMVLVLLIKPRGLYGR
ncbi:MAG: branched-chain amino acid ABC transporter permease [Gammaproteobacteria bacterium]|nr:branched-chain amino acid ABC transporter permease [Gammaproteobacteria bacterium]